jgi:hypothetical protein
VGRYPADGGADYGEKRSRMGKKAQKNQSLTVGQPYATTKVGHERGRRKEEVQRVSIVCAQVGKDTVSVC